MGLDSISYLIESPELIQNILQINSSKNILTDSFCNKNFTYVTYVASCNWCNWWSSFRFNSNYKTRPNFGIQKAQNYIFIYNLYNTHDCKSKKTLEIAKAIYQRHQRKVGKSLWTNFKSYRRPSVLVLTVLTLRLFKNRGKFVKTAVLAFLGLK